MKSEGTIPFGLHQKIEITLTSAIIRLASISVIADDQLQLMAEDDSVKEVYTARAQALMYLINDLKQELQEVEEYIEKIHS